MISMHLLDKRDPVERVMIALQWDECGAHVFRFYEHMREPILSIKPVLLMNLDTPEVARSLRAQAQRMVEAGL